MPENLLNGPATPPSSNDDFAPISPERKLITDKFYIGDASATPVTTQRGELYGHSTLTNAINRRRPELFAATGADAAEQDEIRDIAVAIAVRTKLPEGLLVQLADGFIDARLAEARPVADPAAAEHALATQIATWNTESRQGLVDAYGKDAEAMLKRVQKFVRADPTLARVLDTRGLGSRPEIVLGIASHVFSTGYR